MNKNEHIELRRRTQTGTVTRGDLNTIMPDWSEDERWLVITPHDDDPAISGSMILAHAATRNVRIRVRIVTDGSMGYTPAVKADEVVGRRREETRASFSLLGVTDVDWYDYPDARLYRWQGRIPGDGPHVAAGYTGLENSLTTELRAFHPTRLFIMSAEDFHPDHKMVHQETMISLFHAQGDIWPELGPPLQHIPLVHELAAYCPFKENPDIEFRGNETLFETKIAAIRAFSSQTQIARLAAAVEAAGPREYLRTVPFATYSPEQYASLFSVAEDKG